MFLQLALLMLMALANTGVNGDCHLDDYDVERNLTLDNKHWWDGSYTDPHVNNWSKILKNNPPNQKKRFLVTKKKMIKICFKPKLPHHCFIVHQLCWKAIDASKCESSISCPGAHRDASRSVSSGCMSGSCVQEEVCFKCWKRKGARKMKICLTECDIWANA